VKVKRTKESRRVIPVFALWAASMFAAAGCRPTNDVPPLTYIEYRSGEFRRLEKIRQKKTEKIKGWLSDQRLLIEKDETVAQMGVFFKGIQGSVAGGLKKDFLRINHAVEFFFFYNLGAFYDLLFIDQNDRVFYSVKMEDDFQTSLFHGKYADTKLAKIIRHSPRKVSFVDFEYYGASDEPAAFYILPVNQNETCIGWIAFQLSINHLNKLLTERTGLGQTGEAYLVNKHQLMLTESRFINDDTVLSKKIDTEAVRVQKGSSGSKVIRDYRGVLVLSTFQTFNVGDVQWRILVEKDEDEVVTDYYKNHFEKIYPCLVQKVAKETEKHLTEITDFQGFVKTAKRVDVGELIKSSGGKSLVTSGVSTCTGVVAHMKDNGVSYMAHLSPVDVSYHFSKKEIIPLGDKATDLVSLMLRRILFFEIKPHQIRDLRFGIAAPHTKSLENIIHTLLNAGVLLPQIRVGISPAARSVTLFCNPNASSLMGHWQFESKQPRKMDFSHMPSLGDLVKDCVPAP
jgi:hypothetical protein